MNTNFKILWFEDTLDWYEEEARNVEEHLKSYCLECKITHNKGDESELSNINYADFDLIIVDYKLINIKGTEIKGNEFIEKIRSMYVLTDVLFYSSEYDKMTDELKNNPIDGVYLSKRSSDNFRAKVSKLIEKIIKRSEDIVNLRGMVLDNSSDFENRILNILKEISYKFNDDELNLLGEAVIKCQKKKCNNTRKKNSIILSDNKKYHHIYDNGQYFTNFDHLYVLNKIIEILIEKYKCNLKESEYNDFMNSYKNELLEYRNAFGHINNCTDSITVDGDKIPVNRDLHKLMRERCVKYDILIKKIEDEIKSIKQINKIS